MGDLLNACRALKDVNLPLTLRTYENSGVRVLVASQNEEDVIRKTAEILDKSGSVTAEELSREIGISVVLSKERLLSVENVGLACRDYSVEGLRFYPNRFL